MSFQGKQKKSFVVSCLVMAIFAMVILLLFPIGNYFRESSTIYRSRHTSDVSFLRSKSKAFESVLIADAANYLTKRQKDSHAIRFNAFQTVLTGLERMGVSVDDACQNYLLVRAGLDPSFNIHYQRLEWESQPGTDVQLFEELNRAYPNNAIQAAIDFLAEIDSDHSRATFSESVDYLILEGAATLFQEVTGSSAARSVFGNPLNRLYCPNEIDLVSVQLGRIECPEPLTAACLVTSIMFLMIACASSFLTVGPIQLFDSRNLWNNYLEKLGAVLLRFCRLMFAIFVTETAFFAWIYSHRIKEPLERLDSVRLLI